METIIRTYRFKLYPSKRNRKLHRQIDFACRAYDYCILLHRRYWRLYHRTIHVYALQKHLTKQKKKEKFHWLKELDAQSLQDITQRIDRSYKLFWSNKNHGKAASPPRYKHLWQYHSFTLKQTGWRLDEAHHAVYIRKQKYRYYKSREVEGKIQTVIVKRERNGDLSINFVCQIEENPEKDG